MRKLRPTEAPHCTECSHWTLFIFNENQEQKNHKDNISNALGLKEGVVFLLVFDCLPSLWSFQNLSAQGQALGGLWWLVCYDSGSHRPV